MISSTFALYDQLVTVLMDIGVASRLYMTAPPERVAYPYGILRLDMGIDGAYEGREQLGTLELQLFSQPRSQQPAVEAMGDAAEAALFQYATVVSETAFRVVRRSSRATLEPFPLPADRSIVQVRITWDIEVGPGWLAEESSP